ncbi:DUF4381 domain-containing protein [Pseudaestuariivita atlantica]|uniref:DUF4381 domain-containing protein n=1 Tax=Pseudaestuariivita atlantica TaxID=1317121 RepID=UPI00067D0092|nr:DUF4381 domain-containing protein [Pseudaestuariivita atlantica]
MTPLTPEQQAVLDQLRDIRLPEPVGWWPLAPGWWALAAILLLLVLLALGWSILRRRTRRYQALRELEALRQRLKENPDMSVAGDLAALVRRVALSSQGRRIAGLSGDDWARELAAGKKGIPPEMAELLAEMPYRRPETFTRDQVERLFKPAETWIRRTA